MMRENFDIHVDIIGNQISNLVNTPIEQNFERLARMVKRMFDVPLIVIGLFDEKRKAMKPVVSLDFSDLSSYMPFFNEFNSSEILVIEDATKNERFKNHALVTNDPMVRFIVIFPIFEKNGVKVGSLIMMDHIPRSLDAVDMKSLNEIVKLLETEISSFCISKSQKLFLKDIMNKDKTQFVDAQTKAWNNEGFNQILNYQIIESKKDNSPFGLALITIDNLNEFNSTYSKEVIDDLFALTARTLVTSCRDEDTIGRGIDDEFMVLIHASDINNIKNIVNRIKSNLDNATIKTHQGELSFQVTIGVAVFNSTISNAQDLIQNASIAVMAGKKSGSNCIEFN